MSQNYTDNVLKTDEHLPKRNVAELLEFMYRKFCNKENKTINNAIHDLNVKQGEKSIFLLVDKTKPKDGPFPFLRNNKNNFVIILSLIEEKLRIALRMQIGKKRNPKGVSEN